jgi:hypothetical protein
MATTYEQSICVDLDGDQIAQLEKKYGLRFDDPHVPTSGGSGPGPCTIVIHPAEAEDDCGDCRQRIDVLAEDEELLDHCVADVRRYVQSIGGGLCE